MVTTSDIPLAAYFSHSWSHHDLPINLMLWERLAGHCQLLIDKPEPTAESDRPYFISRIESILRRADLFFGCLPALPLGKQAVRRPDATGDWRYHLCSPYILFELRLAERADLPRFVLYDRASRFQPPPHSAPHVRYVGRHFDELRPVIAAGGQDHRLIEELEQWMAWVARNRPTRIDETRHRTACLLAEDQAGSALQSLVSDTLEDVGFDRPQCLQNAFHTDAELYQAIRSVDLLVVDICRPELWPLYHVAHSLMVPTIRLQSAPPATDPVADLFLPRLLRGHPAGYQLDLPVAQSRDEFSVRLRDRASAITRSTQPILGLENGRVVLYERTYPKRHLVFISHDEKLNDRALVDALVAKCREQGITFWEYAVENRSGDVWRRNMDDALAKATHLIALLSPGYEMSPGCREEFTHAVNSKSAVTLLPFLTHGRTKPSVELRGDQIAHEPLLVSQSPAANAALVVERLRSRLLDPGANH